MNDIMYKQGSYNHVISLIDIIPKIKENVIKYCVKVSVLPSTQKNGMKGNNFNL